MNPARLFAGHSLPPPTCKTMTSLFVVRLVLKSFWNVSWRNPLFIHHVSKAASLTNQLAAPLLIRIINQASLTNQSAALLLIHLIINPASLTYQPTATTTTRSRKTICKSLRQIICNPRRPSMNTQ
ncbi:MAG TPA: hypothetical protein VFR24_26170 [Candidatus Angelobacter sp.]|nr:hypothetical protein [Candidatus Angelobacter sp.]